MNSNCIVKSFQKEKWKIEIWGKALFTLLAFFMNYAIVNIKDVQIYFSNEDSFFEELAKILLAIDTDIVWLLVLFAFFVKFYQIKCADKLEGKRKAASILLATMASISLMVGNAFTKYDGIELLVTGMIQLLKSGVVFAGYFMFFYHLMVIGIIQYDKYMDGEKEIQSAFFEKKKAYFVIFGILMIVWIPTIVAYYPAMFMGDTEDILYMAFNYPTQVAATVKPSIDGIYITNHHPVIYTEFAGTTIRIVRKFGGTDNLAIFFCAMIQCVITAAVLSYSCVYCAKELKNKKIAVAAILFYAFCPWISKYAIMISKDTLFADFILLYGIQLHKVFRSQKKSVISVILLAIAVVLLRKNGVYIVILSLVLSLVLYKKYWKKWLLCFGIIMAFQTGYSNVILPALGIAEGSVREALSVPFQQTARYIQKHGEEVTEDEQEAIDAVLDYAVLAEAYNPNLSDPVKGTYRIEAGSDELKEYFKVWFRMFWKHPGTYIAATINNYYGYFYPIVNNIQKLYSTSVGSMNNANRDGYFQFSNMQSSECRFLREFLAFIDLIWMRIPILNLFITNAFYVWTVIMGIVMKFCRQEKTGFVFVFIYFVLILTVLVGPCNAINYERYIFPCILGFPILIGVLLQETKQEEIELCRKS